MIDKVALTAVVEEALKGSDKFIVDISIKPGNVIVVEIDSMSGMGIDDCVTLSRTIEENFDREQEDYELEVGSAGLTSPFKVKQQYDQYIDNEVEVVTIEGKKLKGILTAANDTDFSLTIYKKVKTKRSHTAILVKERYSERVR